MWPDTQVHRRKLKRMARRYKRPAHRVVNWRTISHEDLSSRLAERDQRQARESRTEAQKWLGDPPPDRSALSRYSKKVTPLR